MFDQLFERPHAVARHRNTALASERLQYLQHLADQNMARMTLRVVAEYLVAIVAHLRLGDRSVKLISQAEIEQQSILWATRHSQGGAKQSPSSRARFVR